MDRPRNRFQGGKKFTQYNKPSLRDSAERPMDNSTTFNGTLRQSNAIQNDQGQNQHKYE